MSVFKRWLPNDVTYIADRADALLIEAGFVALGSGRGAQRAVQHSGALGPRHGPKRTRKDQEQPRSEPRATIEWKRTSETFTYATYNRDHVWHIDGGVDIPASSAPEYKGTMDRVDPERALVAALSSCHMLTFLAIAAKKRLVIDAYEDEAVGSMSKNDRGKLYVSRCTLTPRITWSGAAPSAEELAEMHHTAHEECFIASSVLTEIVIEPR